MTTTQSEAQRLLDGHYKTLVFAAHPDDESIGASFFLQRQQNAYVAFATSGGYTFPDRLHRLGLASLSDYASKRENEAYDALNLVPESTRYFLRFPDGGLQQHLAECFKSLTEAVDEHQPEFVLTHAFEGGHADHDCCSFLVSRLRARREIRAWEMPIYHRIGTRTISQVFRDGTEIDLATATPSDAEITVKRAMLECHRTQVTLNVFNELGVDATRPELYRPQPEYDYYDSSMASSDMAKCFAAFDRELADLK